ncbi:unnamed protein product [Cuscuta campestris]|uniref:Uncharacterized protein n=1 Tax=Cuscuta campestris TaxID=132261 RepID=A0A484KFM9_9ASTE|nr:unnamed protein product [Cuscuta campestris]
MSEKGGKGPEFSNGGKSALKTGEDDSAGKKKGRKVQFGSEDSPDGTFARSNGKADTPFSKGSKGGESGKGQTSKVPLPLELRVEQEIYENTECLMDCEAAEILKGIQEQMVILSEDPTIKLPVWVACYFFCYFFQ